MFGNALTGWHLSSSSRSSCSSSVRRSSRLSRRASPSRCASSRTRSAATDKSRRSTTTSTTVRSVDPTTTTDPVPRRRPSTRHGPVAEPRRPAEALTRGHDDDSRRRAPGRAARPQTRAARGACRSASTSSSCASGCSSPPWPSSWLPSPAGSSRRSSSTPCAPRSRQIAGRRTRADAPQLHEHHRRVRPEAADRDHRRRRHLQPGVALPDLGVHRPGPVRKEKLYALGFFGTAIPLFLAGCCAGWFVLPAHRRGHDRLHRLSKTPTSSTRRPTTTSSSSWCSPSASPSSCRCSSCC